MKFENAHEHRGSFFSVLAQTPLSQVGVMTLRPGQDAGAPEIHSGDQFVYIIEGEADVEVAGEKGTMKQGDIVIVPKGAEHHVANNGKEPLFFLTVYTPPQY